MTTTWKHTAKPLQRAYLRTLLFAGLLLTGALVAYSAMLLSDKQDALLADIKGESQQLKLSLDDTLDVVRGHLFTVQHDVEGSLAQPSAFDKRAGKDDLPDLGSLLLDPKAPIEQKAFQRNLAAAASFMPTAAAMHQWSHVFQWTYFYDQSGHWVLIYPHLTEGELLRTTRTGDIGAALKVFVDADGTRPIFMVGPRNNPKREMLWTPPYRDAAGKGMMVTLLAPVYVADEYVGAVGTDITLKELNQTLREHAPASARALVVDAAGNLLADTDPGLDKADTRVLLTAAFPELTEGLDGIAPEDPAWLRYPIKGSDMTLLVHVPEAQLRNEALVSLYPYLGMALLAFLALLALGWLQNRRYAWPALQLAEYMERCSTSPDAAMPAVPEIWTPMFEQAALAARAQHDLLQRTQAEAEELEAKVAERTAELASANAALEATVASLQKTRHDLVRADRLGSLGGMIAGVANELQGPLDQAKGSASQFVTRLDAFKLQQARGLRKAELEEFVSQADAVGRQVSQDLGAAVDLLSRFKQLAVDQASEEARRFRLHDLAENVLAVMRPVLALHACTVDNRIPAQLEMHAQAGPLGQLLHHLLADAVERAATAPAGVQIELAAAADNDARGERILLSIQDNGSTPEKPQAGMEIARALVEEAFGGEVEAVASAGGSRVTLRLPKAAD